MGNLSHLQLTELSMLKSITRICDRHKLKYYALGGTLLGAIRHGGFIPWDDDIDIAMPRPDYDCFMGLVHGELPAGLRAVTYWNVHGNDNPCYFCQIHKMDSEVVLNFGKEPMPMRVWLDVFPLDAMPSGYFRRGVQKYRMLYQRMKVQFSLYETIAHQSRPNRPLHESMLMKLREITKLGSNWDTIELFAETEAVAKRYAYENEGYCVNLFGAYKFKEMFPKSWLGEGVMMPFEDTQMRCPVEYDKVLTQMYGDYMTPVPVDMRSNQHQMTIVDLGTPLIGED